MLAALLATPMIFQIIGVAISAAGVVVPEIDRIAVRHEQKQQCCCVTKVIYVNQPRSRHARSPHF